MDCTGAAPAGAALAVNVRAVHALVDELPEDDEWPLFWWSGRFRCRLEDGREEEFDSLEAAVAWAREHARHVSVDFEEERHELPLPPEVHARAALGRRRRQGEEWLDRTPEDPPIEWLVELEVTPAELIPNDEVATVAVEALREAGHDDLEMSREELDAGLADIDEQVAGQEGEVGWTTGHSLAYEVSATVFASTRRQVVERAVQIAADAIERHIGAPVWRHTTDEFDTWGVSGEARPVDAPPLGFPPL